MAKILIVEDDRDYAEMVSTWLEHEHHMVESVYSGPEAKATLSIKQYDLIVLDWDLPGISGDQVCREFREHGGKTPIIMLTGRRRVEDKEHGLDIGADDYVTKPVHVKELSARIRALLRRASDTQSNVLRVGDIELDPQSFSAKRDGSELKLSKQEFALLEFFMRNPNRVFSPDALLERVWLAESDASPTAIRACMTRLRQKVDRDGEDSVIRTVHGVGYKLQQ